MTADRKRVLVLSLALLAFFGGMSAASGIGIYGDSQQYITMHVHREPLYPLFLALFRGIAGEGDGGLALAVAAQNLLTAAGIIALAEYLRRRFRLRLPGELLLIALQLAPHIVTKYASHYGIFMESAIMSEALCIPLFQLFTLFMLRMVYERKICDVVCSFALAFLLSLTRTQMVTTLLLWALAVGFLLLLRRRYRRLLLPALALAAAFGARTLVTHTYNYVITGYFIGNTYGPVNILTNVMYAADEADGEVFAEGSIERTFFEQFYREADAIGANYKYGGSTFAEKTAHLEEYHDRLKFDVLDADMSAYFFAVGGGDYYKKDLMADDLARRMTARLLPVCLGQWTADYLRLCVYGLIRSIAVVHPLVNWAAFALYAAAIALLCVAVRRRRQDSAAWVMAFALLFIAANVGATSVTIMCLSRYMIYGFSIFYMALFLLGREILWDKAPARTEGRA